MINWDHAIEQLRAAGLLLDRDMKGRTLVADGRVQRWRVENCDREWRGWTRLSLWVSARGNTYIVGQYGIWHGTDPGTRRIELPPLDRSLSPEEIERRREEAKAAMQAAKLMEKAADEERKAEAKRAARMARELWGYAQPCTQHEYLERKGVRSHGLRLLYSTDGLEFSEPLDQANAFRLSAACQGDQPALLIPMHDVNGHVVGLQFVYGPSHPRHKTRDKEFWPSGMAISGCFGLIGPVYRDGVIVLGEGYATVATVHEATGLTCAYAFSANNLLAAARQLRKAYPRLRILVVADDDYLTEGNPGCKAAAEVAAKVPLVSWVKPVFTDEDGVDLRRGKKLTDFNDLAMLAGSVAVARQIHAALDAVGWRERPPDADGAGDNTGGGDGAGEARCSVLTPDEVVRRFSPVWSPEDVYYFDHLERVVVTKQSIVSRMSRHGWDQVMSHPDWRRKPEVPLSKVDFDPSESDPGVVYNLWGGWPVLQRHPNAKCDALLRLLHWLCSFEQDKTQKTVEWILKWLAYPLQHPGAKMQTAILMHGGQGAGKNTFFDTFLDIYGEEYSVQFGPKQLEKRFNALFSKKLLAIGNEVVASREELYYVKGQIKHMITEKRWVVEAKNKDERWERNNCNFVFLSNELNPQVIEPDDRRHLVVWTPSVPDPEIDRERFDWWRDLIQQAHAERKNGGAFAMKEYLLELDVSDFHVATPPLMTEAKQALIDLNLDSRERFITRWLDEDIDGLPVAACLSEDLYAAYRAWCARVGITRTAPMHSMMAHVGKHRRLRKAQERVGRVGLVEKRTVIIPLALVQPADRLKADWLADEVERFRAALADYAPGAVRA